MRSEEPDLLPSSEIPSVNKSSAPSKPSVETSMQPSIVRSDGLGSSPSSEPFLQETSLPSLLPSDANAIIAGGSQDMPPLLAGEYDAMIPVTERGLLMNIEELDGNVVFVGYRQKPDGTKGPAEMQKLIKNVHDKIIAVNGVSIGNKSFQDVVQLFKQDSSAKYTKIRFLSVHTYPNNNKTSGTDETTTKKQKRKDDECKRITKLFSMHTIPNNNKTSTTDKTTMKKQKRKDDDKKPASKKKKKEEEEEEEYSPEEIEASKEIDRLLQQASEDYNVECGTVDAQLFDESEDKLSLADAKKKLGSVKLLALLQKKLCYACRDEKRLGMFFFREIGYYGRYSADHVDRSVCCHCFSRDDFTRKEICDSGEWTWGQAEKGLKISFLSHRISSNWSKIKYKYNYDGKSWMKPAVIKDNGNTTLFSPYTVTLTALTMSSIWNLHYELAMKEKRRRK